MGGPTLTVYVVGDPQRVDAVRVVAWQRWRHSLRTWGVHASGTPGCRLLLNPKTVQPSGQLADPGFPTLLVVEELLRCGWKRVETVVVHKPDLPGRVFSILDASGKKFYFHVLLNLESVWARGQREVPSDQPQSYYQLLLRGRVVDSKRGDKVYRSMLNDSEPALKLPKTAAEGVDPDIVQDVSEFSQGMQDILEEPPFVPPPVPAEAPELLPEPLAAEAVPADAAGDVVQAPLLDWHDDPHWPRTILGLKCIRRLRSQARADRIVGMWCNVRTTGDAARDAMHMPVKHLISASRSRTGS